MQENTPDSDESLFFSHSNFASSNSFSELVLGKNTVTFCFPLKFSQTIFGVIKNKTHFTETALMLLVTLRELSGRTVCSMRDFSTRFGTSSRERISPVSGDVLWLENQLAMASRSYV